MSTKKGKVHCFACNGIGKIRESSGYAGQEMCGWVDTGDSWVICPVCRGKERHNEKA